MLDIPVSMSHVAGDVSHQHLLEGEWLSVLCGTSQVKYFSAHRRARHCSLPGRCSSNQTKSMLLCKSMSRIHLCRVQSFSESMFFSPLSDLSQLTPPLPHPHFPPIPPSSPVPLSFSIPPRGPLPLPHPSSPPASSPSSPSPSLTRPSPLLSRLTSTSLWPGGRTCGCACLPTTRGRSWVSES